MSYRLGSMCNRDAGTMILRLAPAQSPFAVRKYEGCAHAA
jgi:hypothetical protein